MLPIEIRAAPPHPGVYLLLAIMPLPSEVGMGRKWIQEQKRKNQHSDKFLLCFHCFCQPSTASCSLLGQVLVTASIMTGLQACRRKTSIIVTLSKLLLVAAVHSQPPFGLPPPTFFHRVLFLFFIVTYWLADWFICFQVNIPFSL